MERVPAELLYIVASCEKRDAEDSIRNRTLNGKTSRSKVLKNLKINIRNPQK